MNLAAVQNLASIASTQPAPASSGSAGNFGEMIGAAISAVESAHDSAQTVTADLLISGKGDVHNVALESQRAELALELFQQVRNKLVQSYQEIMKMPM